MFKLPQQWISSAYRSIWTWKISTVQNIYRLPIFWLSALKSIKTFLRMVNICLKKILCTKVIQAHTWPSDFSIQCMYTESTICILYGTNRKFMTGSTVLSYIVWDTLTCNIEWYILRRSKKEVMCTCVSTEQGADDNSLHRVTTPEYILAVQYSKQLKHGLSHFPC